jgi:hypothetical protein
MIVPSPSYLQCSFCGEATATGSWWGLNMVLCCADCAVSAMPKLMADALMGAHGIKRSVLLRCWKEARYSFLAAVGLHDFSDLDRLHFGLALPVEVEADGKLALD